jgi:hypothetical protein
MFIEVEIGHGGHSVHLPESLEAKPLPVQGLRRQKARRRHLCAGL